MSEYLQLITEIYDRLDKKTEQDFFINNSDFERLEEHNLWTYWQGRGVRHPKIMVVGQDWGSLEQSKKYFEYIKNHPNEKVVSYEQVKKENPKMSYREFTTDRELRNFFNKYLGYADICENQYKDLYFTNLVPGFRNDSSSTRNGTELQMEIPDIINDFIRLLNILHPEFILCLGKLVSESIDKAYNGEKSVIDKAKNYNEYLDEALHADSPQPITLDLGNGNYAKMFALAHMGGLGKSNRTRYYKDKPNKKTVIDDWEVVADYINGVYKSRLYD